jgi:hypothetical protein
MSNGKSHRQNCKAKSERDPKQSDPHLRKCGGNDGTSAPSKHQPKCSNRLGASPSEQWHRLLLICVKCVSFAAALDS